jgi:ribulose-5-phosphate 4-epimerase/fuculose-1-phosphate aldolase
MLDSVLEIHPNDFGEAEIRQARVDLAAAFRWFARIGMNEGVANHLSTTVSRDGSKFLMNPRCLHFSRVTASSLLLLDANDPKTLERADAPDPTAWYIHGRLHAKLPQARAIMHLHPRYSTALAGLEDCRMLPIDQNTMRFYDRVAIDEAYGGMALSDEEGDRLAGLMGDKQVLLMSNHGLLTAADSIALTFDLMYYYERAAETQMLAYATGKKLRVASDNVAKLTAQQWAEYPDLADDHLREVKAILDREEPDYRD